MPTRMSTTARIRFMLPFCFEGGTAVSVAAVSGAAVTLVSVVDVRETVVSVVLVIAGGGAVVVVAGTVVAV